MIYIQTLLGKLKNHKGRIEDIFARAFRNVSASMAGISQPVMDYPQSIALARITF
jgi:hypothetical protein